MVLGSSRSKVLFRLLKQRFSVIQTWVALMSVFPMTSFKHTHDCDGAVQVRYAIHMRLENKSSDI